MKNKFKVASFFTGAGGLDLGFKSTGVFDVMWANDKDGRVFPTFEKNFPGVTWVQKSIELVKVEELPRVHGFVGGPPCQSWSEAGARRGINDPRGQLFQTYIDLLAESRPAFFLAENVSGILSGRNSEALANILRSFSEAGYDVYYGLLNASDYEVPQDRERVIFIGFRTDLAASWEPPTKVAPKKNLRDALSGIPFESAIPVRVAGDLDIKPSILNHQYLDSDHYSFIYMSRNRRRSWDECSFTIQATASYAPLHPDSGQMVKLEKDIWKFAEGKPKRRLSVRECAAIQTFPNDFEFLYSSLATGYRMVGNAVPVRFAYHLAKSIQRSLEGLELQLEPLPIDFKLKPGSITRF